jgi:hypothetical protein
MPASTPDDPFRAAGREAEAPELAELPSRARATVDITPPPRLIANPRRRKPVKYQKPNTSWVTVFILAFAAVGMATVGGALSKRLLGGKDRTAQSVLEEAQAVHYSSLSNEDAVLVRVVVSPQDARLMLDGDQTVSNPLRFLRSKTPHKISVTAAGYLPAAQEVVPDASKTIRFTLQKQE